MADEKMRVYEIAKEVGIPNKDLIAKMRALGLEVNNHMSSVGPDDYARIKRSLEKDKATVTPAQTLKLSSGTVLRRRSAGDKTEVVSETPPPATTPAPSSTVIRRSTHARTDAESAPSTPVRT